MDNFAINQPYRYLWAKADRSNPVKTHRLIYHMIDVGQVAKALWKSSIPTSLRTRFAGWLGCSEDEAEQLIAFWAALHDLGKASPAFQIKLPPIISELRNLGFDIPNQIDKPTPHAIITAWALLSEDLLKDSDLDPRWKLKIALMLSGHHGAWQAYDSIKNVPESERGGQAWLIARQHLVNDLRIIFSPPACNPCLNIYEQNTILTVLSGFISVVDWLGSAEELFNYQTDIVNLPDYVAKSAGLAWAGLQTKGWLNTHPDPIPFDFQKLFSLPSPSATQQKVIDLAGCLSDPSLVIIESPTGSGKTESALSLYALWAQTMRTTGIYMAMPTTATSDQMHERVKNFLSLRHTIDIEPLLVHSRALLRESDLQISPGFKVDEDPSQRQTWFLPRKRSLLAPFGVGTVDQAFLSVLQTRHFFVRLFGLSHKVVIFDEVHAYDTYMAELFCRLLSWLKAINTSVILLSATLPEKSRRQFVKAYTGEEDISPSVAYPRLTVASSKGTQVHPLPAPEARIPLKIEWILRDEGEIITRVRKELQHNGCMAIICNTVRRAQKIYLALEAANQEEQFCPPDDLVLFHARTTQKWRDETQSFVLNALSKEARKIGTRPPCMVVVATQVIEQSLDLDFDVMITDLAPLDLLVQRAGRLHRHPPSERVQPYRLLVTTPDIRNNIPNFPRVDFPYEAYFLYRTWAVLQDVQELTLTSAAPHLIEQVYGDADIPQLTRGLSDIMEKARQKCEKECAAAELEAGQRLVDEPGDPKLIGKRNLDLEEDNPEVSRALQALTRRSATGISLICVHRINDTLYLDSQGNSPVDVENPTPQQILGLARCAISVQNQRVVEYFTNQEQKDSWKKIAALRYARLAIFDNNAYIAGSNFALRLTRTLGLQIDYRKSGAQDDEL